MVKYRFTAYKMEFLSAFEPPGQHPLTDDSNAPDVLIEVGNCPAVLDSAQVVTEYCSISANELLLHINNVASYHVKDGRIITVAPFPDADLDKVRLFLFGSALGALLYQRGFFPIHGAAVNTDFGVMIFVGEQGAGKSTLAARFYLNGYSLLSDDVCAVTRGNDGQLIVLPAFAQIRLCDDALAKLGPLTSCPLARFDVDKYVVSLVDGYALDSAQLAAIYLLSNTEGNEISLNRMSGFARLNLLIENLYRPFYLTGLSIMPEVMRLAAEIASSAEVYEIKRPRDFLRINELILGLKRHWQELSLSNVKGDVKNHV